MKTAFAALMVAALFVGIAGVSLASGTQEEAKTMVENAIVFLKANGKEKAIAEFNNPKGKFVNGDV
jgi:cytochrome c